MGVNPQSVSCTLDAGQSEIIAKHVTDVPVVITPKVVRVDEDLSITFRPPSQPLTNGSADFDEKISVSSSAKPGSLLKATVDFLVNGQSTNDPSFVQLVVVSVPKHDTSLSVADVTAAADSNGKGSCTLSATLIDSVTKTPIAGASVQFAMPSGFVLANNGVSTTDRNGVATCACTFGGMATGNYMFSASFAGDASHNLSNGKGNCLVYTMDVGAYVIGDKNATSGNSVMFWGSDWASKNQLSQTPSLPDQFKGYATSHKATSSDAGSYEGDPGNSGHPASPPGVGQYIGVLAASSAQSSGGRMSGNYVKIAIVKVTTAPGTDPGHPGYGTVV